MRGITKLAAFAAAAVTIAGLSAGVAAAGPQAGSGGHHLILHGTGGLRPDMRRPADGRPEVNADGLPIQYSNNWSGYIALPKSGKTKTFRYVQANFTVPSVNCGVTPTAFNYQWVGLDGDTDGTVEQDGVGGYCVNGSPTYFAWSEMYPAGVDEQFYLNPGDAVTASVYYDSTTRQYELALTDLTSGQTFSVDESCASTCNNSSAEVITEGYPSGNYGGTSDFGSVHFDTIWVTNSGGTRGELTNTNWVTDESIAQGASNDVTTEPGALYAASSPSTPLLSAFEDNWHNED